jgi:hypothetical protein
MKPFMVFSQVRAWVLCPFPSSIELEIYPTQEFMRKKFIDRLYRSVLFTHFVKSGDKVSFRNARKLSVGFWVACELSQLRLGSHSGSPISRVLSAEQWSAEFVGRQNKMDQK